jgi:hypothetical protein
MLRADKEGVKDWAGLPNNIPEQLLGEGWLSQHGCIARTIFKRV